MKLLVIVTLIFLVACITERPEAEFQSVVITKVDTVYRFGQPELMVTLECKRVEYVSFASIDNVFIVGTRYRMFLKK